MMDVEDSLRRDAEEELPPLRLRQQYNISPVMVESNNLTEVENLDETYSYEQNHEDSYLSANDHNLSVVSENNSYY